MQQRAAAGHAHASAECLPMIEFGTPATPAELEEYFAFRWVLLRAPWGQPRGSERDEHDEHDEQAGPVEPDAAPARQASGATFLRAGHDARGPVAAPASSVVHVAARHSPGLLVAVGRLHFNTANEAQIRYMATHESYRGQGIGTALVRYLEAAARARGARCVVLNARDTAVGFYARLGYAPVGSAPTLFGAIPHTRMQKRLEP